MLKASFYIPENFVDGSAVPISRLQELREFLTARFGGYSLTGKVEGAWKDPRTGEVHRDISLRFEVALREDDIAELKEYLRAFKRELAQRTIYFEIDRGASVELL